MTKRKGFITMPTMKITQFDKDLYKLQSPYYNHNYKGICDKLYSYSHKKKYLKDCIRLYHYLTITCGHSRYKIQGTDLVNTEDIVFNPLKDGSDLLHIIVRLINDERTHDKICKLLYNDHKEYIYKNAILKEINNVIKKEYDLDILKLYTKYQRILIKNKYFPY